MENNQGQNKQPGQENQVYGQEQMGQVNQPNRPTPANQSGVPNQQVQPNQPPVQEQAYPQNMPNQQVRPNQPGQPNPMGQPNMQNARNQSNGQMPPRQVGQYTHQDWQTGPNNQNQVPFTPAGNSQQFLPNQGQQNKPPMGQVPMGQVPNQPMGPGSYPQNQGGYPPYMANQAPAKTKNRSYVFPVLLSVFLTFILTASLIWGLASQGILPGTGRTGKVDPNTNVENVGDFGLSIHSTDPAAKAEAEKLAQIIDILQNNYYKVMSPQEMIAAMSQGLTNSMGSKYTYYMSKEDYNSFTDSVSGNYSGIGATVTMTDNKAFQVVSVIANGPAAKAGLQAGDIIVAVDGKATTDFKSINELVTTVKGKDGTSVKLKINRAGVFKEFTITRAKVELEPVHVRMLDKDTGYMNITEFSENLPKYFQAGIETLLKDGAKQIVFDMRGNPGGSAKAVVECLDMLLPEGEIATIRGREKGKALNEVWTSKAGMIVPEDMRYTCLVNGSTASAAELFSGCLRDYDKAVLVGDTTYGKGSGTMAFKLQDGSAINVTIFNYFLPKGDMIEETGLPAQIKTDLVSADYRMIPQYELTPEQDPSLKASLDYFAGKIKVTK